MIPSDDAVELVAKAVGVPAVKLTAYEWDGHISKYHRTQIRRFTGFREYGVADAEKVTGWLVEQKLLRRICSLVPPDAVIRMLALIARRASGLPG